MISSVILPKKLEPNSLIGIIAPSDQIQKDSDLKKGIKSLRDLGFKVVLGNHVFKKEKQPSTQQKSEDINNFFENHNIQAIIAAQGGNGSEKLLKYLDFEAIRKNPKIIMGVSDISVILNAIYSKTGLVCFHGPDLLFGLGKSVSDYTLRAFKDRLMNKGNLINYEKKLQVLRSGICRGILIGGNIMCFCKLLNTKFLPNVNDKILFFEGHLSSIKDVKKYLIKLEQQGYFKSLKGIILGDFKAIRKQGLEDKLVSLFSKKFTKIPVVKINEFGHIEKNTILPIGSTVEINTMKSRIEICKPFLK